MQLDRPFLVITPTVDGDVLAALATASSAFTGRGLHQLIGRYSAEGVRRALERLSRQGIVQVAVAGPSKLYSLNRDHVAAPHIMALARLREQFLDQLRARIAGWDVRPAYAALFGSAAGQQMRTDSDIDVLIVRPDSVAADNDGWTSQLLRLAHDGSSWTGNDLRVLEMSVADIKLGVAGDDHVLSDIRDLGIRLFGPVNYLRPRAAGAGRRPRHG